MRAQPGDRIIVDGDGVSARSGVVQEVLGVDGAPPYRVAWDGESLSSIYYPGSGARVVGGSEGDTDRPSGR